MPRYSVPRGPYQHHPASPKEAALRAVVADRFKIKAAERSEPEIPSIFGFPAYVGDVKTVIFERDGSLSMRLSIPPEHVDDIYRYLPYLAGQIMAITMEPIKVTAADLLNANLSANA